MQGGGSCGEERCGRCEEYKPSEAGHSGRLATIIIVPYRSSAKKKWFLLQTLEPEKVSGSWGGASQVEASSGEFRVHYFLFLFDHLILLAAASQEALGPRKEPAGLLPGSDDRPADVLLSLWAKMLPFINNLLDKSPVRKKTESNIPSISKWENTVKDVRQRESFSFLWLWTDLVDGTRTHWRFPQAGEGHWEGGGGDNEILGGLFGRNLAAQYRTQVNFSLLQDLF